MGAEIKAGAAEPAAKAENPAGGEFSAETMSNVFAKFGKKLPAGAKPEGEQKTAAEAGGGAAETAEEKTAREALEAERAAETPEQKAERETAEAAAAAETPEEKAARESEEAAGDHPEQDADAKATAAETEKIVKAKLKDLPEAQRKIAQSIIDERIGAITGKAKQEAERLGARVVEMTTELETAQKATGPAIVSGVHPAMLADTPEQIDAIADQLDRDQDMLEQFRESGIEADEAKGIPAFTADQVRTRLREIARERDRLLPKAREHLTARMASETELRKTLPELFDPKSEEYRQAAQIRKALPELRRLPDAAAFVAKLVLGTKVLAERAKKPAVKAGAGGAGAPEKKNNPPPTTRRATRAPGDGSAAPGSVLDDPRSQQPDAAAPMKQFATSRSRTDLKKAVGALVFR